MSLQAEPARPALLADGWEQRRAPLGRRVIAVCIDWAACWAVTVALSQANLAFVPLIVFAIENVVFVGTLGFTLGHRIAGLKVVRLEGGPPGLWRALQRTVLLCLVLPAVVWDTDGRGLHDRAARTAIVRFHVAA